MNKIGVLRRNCENQDRMGLAWPKGRELGALDQGGREVETQTRGPWWGEAVTSSLLYQKLLEGPKQV